MNLIPTTVLPIAGLPPAADAAGRIGDWINTRGAKMIYIVAHVNQGNAATVLLSVLQATSAAGAGSKAVDVVPIFTNLDTDAGNAFTRQTNAATYTTDAAVKNKIVVFVLDPATLDMGNGFKYISLSTGASNVANITSALYMIEMSYQQDSAIDMLT